MQKKIAISVWTNCGRDLICTGLALQGLFLAPSFGLGADRPKPIRQDKPIATDSNEGSSFRLIQFTGSGESDGSGSISSAFKKAGDSISGFFTSEPRQPQVENDPISLSSMPDEINANVYLSAARMMENSGNFEGAERQYKSCLEKFPKSRLAQISYARLLHRTQRLDESLVIYQMADKDHPKDPTICNDMGLCLARMGRKGEAMAKFHQATLGAPEDPRYRNNLAMVLVDAGRPDEALSQLVYAHGKAKGHFNLGFLLYRKGDHDGAVANFEAALQQDANLTQAADMLQRIQGKQIAGQDPRTAPMPKTNTMFISDQPRQTKSSPVVVPSQSSKIPPAPESEPPRLLPPVR
ncbi:Tetratricopeptide repeat protein [Bremerella volcania]|uniref:Tetratricopeptide repeat protein n=1 Tax=Bremerella volcania TaxID=2527984 RepID=A0A518CA14_9BACT|nr:tetratricopeptide repeat protein [Bremerella volcania]QDU76061.1 Tetratricopeptide repeat protein [Bremerella volcania]